MWLAVALSACSETCPTPTDALNGREWSVFSQAASYTIDGESFPAESTPASGTHTVSIDWSSRELDAPVVVTVDGQSFDGEGVWSDTECGTFSIAYSGVYLAEDGAEHAFAASTLLTTWLANPARLEGFVDWDESWASVEGEVGTFSADLQWFGRER
ncbi:MAG: hypothetical protein ABMB14_06405 [Myxococcota bacterium]